MYMYVCVCVYMYVLSLQRVQKALHSNHMHQTSHIFVIDSTESAM